MDVIDIVGNEELVMVVHGSEAFDHGDVAWLMDIIRPARVLVAGVMARTAAEESGLPVECIDMPPSRLLSSIHAPAFLVNHGKTPESGLIFGDIVARRLGSVKGLVHLECSSRRVYLWNGGDDVLAGRLAEATGFVLERRIPVLVNSMKRREIRGCLPGEAVFVNGIVIGHATEDTVVLEEQDGEVCAVSGLEIKPHGLEKLRARGPVDLSSAWCKSGMIRNDSPRIGFRGRDCGKIVIVDHCGQELYRMISEDSVCGVLSIGDDTTAVCGHICCHLGIPVLGIVDGDADGIVKADFPPGSVVFRVQEGRDDDMGRMVVRSLPASVNSWSSWRDRILEALKGRGYIMLQVPEAEHDA